MTSPSTPTPYEAAVARVELAARGRVALRELTAWLDREEDAAATELSRYEQAPGIPRPEYLEP